MSYDKIHITLHWLTALLVIGMMMGGMAYSFDLVGAEVLRVHQWSGQALILVLIARIAYRFAVPPQPHETGHARAERLAAKVTHVLLYVTLVGFVVTGYVSASALRETQLIFPVDRVFARSDLGEQLLYAHFALKWVLLALLALHVAGALKHLIIDRDGTLRSIWFSSPPSPKKGPSL